MSDVLDINESDLHAELLRLDSDRRERRLTALQCIQKTYDLLAGKLVNQGLSLTDRELRQTIPSVVLEAALKYGWTPDPRYRHQRRTRARFASFPHVRTSAALSVIPDSALVKQLGTFRVTAEYLTWWLGLLGGRIRFWEAHSLDSPDLKEEAPASDLRRDVTRNQKTEAPPKRALRPSSHADRAARRAILKVYMAKKELATMDDLARHLGVSRAALYGMTTGDVNRYSADKLHSVLEKIGCARADWDSEA